MFNYNKSVFCIIALILALSLFAGCSITDTTTTTTAPNTTTTTQNTTTTTTPSDINPAGVTVVAPTQAWSAAYDAPYLQQLEDDFDVDGAVEEIRLYYDDEFSRYVIAAWEYKALDHVFMFTVDEGVTWSLNFENNNVHVTQTDADGKETKYHLYTFNGNYGLETDGIYSVPFVNGDVTFRTSRYKYDIDGDGKEEYCVLEPYKERPYHMFTFLVFENEDDLAPKYYDVFDYTTMYDLAFAKTADGELVLFGTRYGYAPTQQVWDIRIENNSIYLSVDGKDVRSYIKEPPNYISEPWFVNPSIYSDPRNTLYTDLNENGTDEKFCLAYTYETAGATEFEWALVTYNDNGTIDLWHSLGKHQVLEFYEENGNFYIRETTNGVSKAFGKLIYNGEYSTVNIYE